MSNQSAEAQTVANALSGEKAFETVRFAVTGNENADALAGIHAVLSKIPLNRNSPIPHARYAAMLLKYLAECYAVEAAVQEERAKRDVDPVPMIHGALINPAYPAGYPQQPYNEWTTTSDGTGAIAAVGPKLSDGDMLDKISADLLIEERNAHRAAMLEDLIKNRPPA